jgi:hypothetical protein
MVGLLVVIILILLIIIPGSFLLYGYYLLYQQQHARAYWQKYSKNLPIEYPGQFEIINLNDNTYICDNGGPK